MKTKDAVLRDISNQYEKQLSALKRMYDTNKSCQNNAKNVFDDNNNSSRPLTVRHRVIGGVLSSPILRSPTFLDFPIMSEPSTPPV